MSKEKIVGHDVTENGQYIMVTQRSERPLGGLLGFVVGTLIALGFLPESPLLHIFATIVASTLVGYIFSNGRSSREVLKQRVVKITRKRRHVIVYYVVHDNPLVVEQ